MSEVYAAPVMSIRGGIRQQAGPEVMERVSKAGVFIGGAALGLVAGVAGTGIWAYNQLQNMVPQQSGAPSGSSVTAKQLKLESEDRQCYSYSVFDAAGSSVLTQYKVAGLTVNGYGAVMESGKLIKETCVDAQGVKIDDTKVDGKDVKLVSIKVSDIRVNTQYSTADTKIVRRNPAPAKILGGAIDFTSGTAVAACKQLARIPGNPVTAENCEQLGVISNWNEDNQATVDQVLRLKVQDYVQRECGNKGWVSEQAAFADGYKSQAVAQAANNPAAAKLVVVQFVDDKGKVTKARPDFGRSAWEKELKDGTLQAGIPGAPEVAFQAMDCQLNDQYQSKY